MEAYSPPNIILERYKHHGYKIYHAKRVQMIVHQPFNFHVSRHKESQSKIWIHILQMHTPVIGIQNRGGGSIEGKCPTANLPIQSKAISVTINTLPFRILPTRKAMKPVIISNCSNVSRYQ